MPVDVKEHSVTASSSDAGQSGAKALATLLGAEALAGASARRDRAGRAGQSNGGRGGGEQREKARRLGRESCVAWKKGGRAAERAG